jgi:hypothetical protein
MQASSTSTIEPIDGWTEIHSVAGTINSGESELQYCQGSFLGQAKIKSFVLNHYD